jgi:hypothetical protein
MATVDWSGYNQLLAKVTVTSSPKSALFVEPTPGTKSWSFCSAPTIAKTAIRDSSAARYCAGNDELILVSD